MESPRQYTDLARMYTVELKLQQKGVAQSNCSAGNTLCMQAPPTSGANGACPATFVLVLFIKATSDDYRTL